MRTPRGFRDARLHILIDLNSHTRGGRLDDGAAAGARLDELLSGTRGRAARASSTTCPPTARSCRLLARHYTERLVHLPHLEHASQHGVAYRLPSAPPPAGLNRRAVLASWNSEKSWARATGRSG